MQRMPKIRHRPKDLAKRLPQGKTYLLKKVKKSEAISGALLGVECGGTRTVVLSVEPGAQPFQAEFGPANLRLLNDAQLIKHLHQIRSTTKTKPPLRGIVIGMAGARTAADRERIRLAASKVWPGVPCYATNDLETALAAHSSKITNRVLVLSGTGSCCFGRSAQGKTLRFGGWGHLLGDQGSGYDIGLRALRAAVHHFDLHGKWSALGELILGSLQLNVPDDLIDWAKSADKTQIAALTFQVFRAAERKDRLALEILAHAARTLAQNGHDCARQLFGKQSAVEFVLSGSLFQKQPGFVRQFRANLRKLWPNGRVTVLEGSSVWGAIRLAEEHFGKPGEISAVAPLQTPKPEANSIVSLELSPTEQRNPRSMNLDKLSLAQAVDLMISEDARISAGLSKEKRNIEKAVAMVIGALKNGGRLFYVGAGSSGRLGVLDASEIPPTFRADPQMVQGIMAGGYTALWRSVEGAEDDLNTGAEAIRFRGVTKKDVVLGIAASGRTPFVWGALGEAKTRGARTILLCFNPHLQVPAAQRPSLIIAPNVGPEILTGSTRLKSGTATKMVLNMITTLAMVKMGKVLGNLMVDLNPSNTKLRDRAVRMVCEITGADPARAKSELAKTQWLVKEACKRLR